MRARILLFVLAISCALPLEASAHASPVEYVPADSAVLSAVPEEVSARFSERIDSAASFLRVTGPTGVVSGKSRLGVDAKTLVVPVDAKTEGLYTVRWSVVSADDGHFTRGEYTFTVGAAASAGSAASFELVVATTRSEALGMTLEFIGNGMLWALLLCFALCVRPLLVRFKNELPLLWRGYFFFGVAAVVAGLAGQTLQLYVKAIDLAALNGVSFIEALTMFSATTAGSALLVRAAALALVGLVFALTARRVFTSSQITLSEWGMAGCLLVFAFFRATISHATANPFFPEISVGVNMLHLIEKDIWAGLALVLFSVALSPRLHNFLSALLPQVSRMLAVTVALAGLTGAYITWLHLESLDNLLTTSWGEALLPLGVAVVLLVSARVINTVRPTVATLGAELVFSLLLIYYSSVIILTSPPLHSVRILDGFAFGAIALATVAGALGVLLFVLSRTMPALVSTGVRYARLGVAAALLIFAVVVMLLPYVGLHNAFRASCESDGNMWHFMLPMRAGVPTSDVPREGCMWGMGNYLYMFAEQTEYERYRSLGEAEVELVHPPELISGVPVDLVVSLTDKDGNPAELFVDMEKLVHMVIVSKDQSTFAHIHAAETAQEKAESVFRFSYVFPKAGEYLVSVDYAHGVSLQSRQFRLTVYGGVPQGSERQYGAQGTFGGYAVSLKYSLPIAGKLETLRYEIAKDGKPVENLEQYLSAAMHISVIKNDFSEFMHLHGEVHASGTPIVAPVVRNGKIVHDMRTMIGLPTRFGPNVEAHVLFPSAGLYTIWGEFKVDGRVVPTAFTVRVEE